MRVGVWFEYVASKANIADFASRGVFDMLHDMGSEPRELIMPELSGWDEGAGAWFACMVRAWERGRDGRSGPQAPRRAARRRESQPRRKRRRGAAGVT